MYVLQLAVNAVWTPVFFGLYPLTGVGALWGALLIIVALDLAVLMTILRFWKVSRIAAALLIPYGAWLLYATSLNAAAAALNP
jgi:tryptophan-rich sensory protein